MKRFFAKLARFFWSRGFLIFVLAIIAFVILFYAEEDWRGARAWAATKAEWEAKGETFDYTKFIPPPIPDDQNLAAIPLFKLEPVKDYDGTSSLESIALKKALRTKQAERTDYPNWQYYSIANWQLGESSDMTQIRVALAKNYTALFKDAKPPDDTLDQFNAIYPFYADFMRASSAHPLFRLNLDYTIPMMLRPLGPITQELPLAKILALHGILALDHHQSDIAMQDLKTNYKLLSGVKRDPTLVADLVSIGIATINYSILFDGLAQHAWTDNQLTEIDHSLKQIDFLANYQFAMRSEVENFSATFDSLKEPQIQPDPVYKAVAMLPSGWVDCNKSQMAEFLFRDMATVDPKSRLVFPKVDQDIKDQILQLRTHWTRLAPWNILFTIAIGPMSAAMQHSAKAQVWLDEARIACALERYRLAHNAYPESLPVLVPACIDELPHDIMNGEPYHYQLRPDGTYLLYSVGWNQTDDGGKVAFKKDNPKAIDYENGDWPWPTPLPATSAK